MTAGSTVAIIGDVHGHLEPLKKIVRAARERTDSLVFVGDYINRGPNSAGVIDFLIGLSRRACRPVFLRGNHEASFLRYLNGGDIADFLMIGGASTLCSYADPGCLSEQKDLRGVVPNSHTQFLKRLEDSYLSDGLLVTHSIRDPMPTQLSGSPGRVFRVAGHAPQRREPILRDDSALIDTGCGTWDDGRLTCLFWPTLDWLQTS